VLGQVIEGIGLHQAAGMDKACEHIADIRPELALKEKRILSIQNHSLKTPFAQIVVEMIRHTFPRLPLRRLEP
jgi:hypothetical protein